MRPLSLLASLPFLSALVTFPAAAAETGEAAPAEPSASDAAGARPARHVSLALDPLGFLLFGPTLNADVAIGKVAVGAGFRWLSPGVAARALFLDDDSKFAFSYGVAGRAGYFFQEPLAGPYAGVAVEMLHTRVEDDTALIATLSTYVVPELEGGYRLALGSFFLGGVLAFGYAAQVDSRVEDLPGGSNAWMYEVLDESSVYGAARLDLGVYF